MAIKNEANHKNKEIGIMTTHEKEKRLQLEIPGRDPMMLTQLLLDFTGTLSCDGRLLKGVAERLKEIGRVMTITVLTADTFGKASEQLEGLPLKLKIIKTGRDKKEFISQFKGHETAAIGNGVNDLDMIRMAALGIAVIGPEGCAGELVASAKIVCPDILAALDLFFNPLRIKATLRE